MTAVSLYRAGQLAAARDAQTAAVKANPSDSAARTFLFELLCFDGQLERATKQLDVIEQLDSTTAQAAQVYRNILHAEGLRQSLFSGGSAAGFLLDPGPDITPRLEAIRLLAQGDSRAASESLDHAETLRPATAGDIDGAPFDDIRDCDDLLAPVVEMIVLRDYIWLPFSQLKSLRISTPERPRDLIWVPISATLVDDKTVSGYSPVLYPGSHEQGDESIALGRQTDWSEVAPNIVRGKGLKTLLAGEEAVPYLSAREIHFRSSDL